MPNEGAGDRGREAGVGRDPAGGERTAEGPYTITEADVGRFAIHAFGQVQVVADFLGRVLPIDVGKLVYRRGDVLQVENDAQRSARLAAVDRSTTS